MVRRCMRGMPKNTLLRDCLFKSVPIMQDTTGNVGSWLTPLFVNQVSVMKPHSKSCFFGPVFLKEASLEHSLPLVSCRTELVVKLIKR
jgi:hypothetical protein